MHERIVVQFHGECVMVKPYRGPDEMLMQKGNWTMSRRLEMPKYTNLDYFETDLQIALLPVLAEKLALR